MDGFKGGGGVSDWAVHESGMISQSLTDMNDDSVRLFTETAMDHNQSIYDATGGAPWPAPQS